MGVGRALYVFLFPLLFSVVGLGLALVTFFSGYEHATGLRSVNFMTIDLGNVTVAGINGTAILESSNISTLYAFSTNGWCSGNSTGKIEACKTSHEPFYVSIDEFLEDANLSLIKSFLPEEITSYNSTSKTATLAIWGCSLATIILAFFTCVFGIFAMCSYGLGWLAGFFAILALVGAILGAALATGSYYIFAKKFNDAGAEYGVKASLRVSGLACAWATVVTFFIVDVLFMLAGCCCVQRRTRYQNFPEKRY